MLKSFKNIVIIFASSCITLASFSQKEASNWYFGENAGIHFNEDGSVSSLDDGMLNTREGCSSISDWEGNLLFYTDGIIVYNKNHDIMLNGTGLQGDSSSTQSAIVVPKPGNPNIYYVFTNNRNLKYSTIDISRDNGFGEVILKNQFLLNRGSEKIAAVLKDCNSEEIWVLAFSNYDGSSFNENNTFHAFKVSNTGVNTFAVRSSFQNMSIST